MNPIRVPPVVGCLLAVLLLPLSLESSAQTSFTTNDVNMRAGPDRVFPRRRMASTGRVSARVRLYQRLALVRRIVSTKPGLGAFELSLQCGPRPNTCRDVFSGSVLEQPLSWPPLVLQPAAVDCRGALQGSGRRPLLLDDTLVALAGSLRRSPYVVASFDQGGSSIRRSMPPTKLESGSAVVN